VYVYSVYRTYVSSKTDKMKSYIIIAFLFLTKVSFGQDWRFEEYIPKYKSEILSPENLTKEKESRILRDLSFIGAYEELYLRNNYQDSSLQNEFKRLMKSYIPKSAKEFILSKSQSEQVIIINESHHRPEHRKFTTDLLEVLYEQGFRYLALEAILSNHSKFTKYPRNRYYLGDTTILNRGYPLMKACSGTYVKEPAFGNMIRKALKLGYTIIGYEKGGGNRELNQAENLAKLIADDPKAKILIHCGYGHLIESPRKYKEKHDTLMAGYLKEITKINPFTIDQTNYYNYSAISDVVFGKINDTEPQCLISNNICFKSHLPEQQDYWDMTVFHHPIEFVDNRPYWLVADSDKRTFILNEDEICIEYPLRIKLLNIDDRLDAVPLDIMETYDAVSQYKLYGNIDKGKIVIENPNGDRQVKIIE